MPTRIHLKYVHKNSPTKRNSHGQKMSTRIPPLKMSTKIRPFWKSFYKNSPSLALYRDVEPFKCTKLLVPIFCFFYIFFLLTSKVFFLDAAVQAEISSCYSNIGFEIPTLDCDKAFVWCTMPCECTKPRSKLVRCLGR